MLSIKSGLITCENRIIVPKEMRSEMLQYIHKGHQGRERCHLRARNTVFGPRLATMSSNSQRSVSYARNMESHNQS